jgi:hypothetical protein
VGAAVRFLAGFRAVKDEDDRHDLLLGYLDAMIRAKRAVDAYVALPDKVQAFRLLASKLSAARFEDGLARLLDAAADLEGIDLLRRVYVAERDYLAGDHAAAAKAFRSLADLPVGERVPPEAGAPDPVDRLLRSLALSGAGDAALREQETRLGETGRDFYRLMVAAQKGDVPTSTAAFDALVAQGWTPEELARDDADLAALLAKPAFAPLLEKHGLAPATARER